MKKVLILLSLTMSLFLHSGEYPHLILNFDVNKTLIASDKTENKSLEDVINELLSRRYFACWDEAVLEPISFDAYVRTVMMPGEEHDAELKMARLVHLTHFIDFLKERNHPLYSVVLDEFNHIIETLQGAHIFPSFFKFTDYLSRKGISYTLFLRSFGKEVFEVKDEINQKLEGLFEFEGKFRNGILYVEGEEPLTTPREIYSFVTSKRHGAIQDDWHYWMKGEMYARCGKPFYIDQEDRNTLSLFFDDNIKINSFEKNVISPLDSGTGASLPVESALESKQMIFVDTIEAILDENYFIGLLEEALAVHGNFRYCH